MQGYGERMVYIRGYIEGERRVSPLASNFAPFVNRLKKLVPISQYFSSDSSTYGEILTEGSTTTIQAGKLELALRIIMWSAAKTPTLLQVLKT